MVLGVCIQVLLMLFGMLLLVLLDWIQLDIVLINIVVNVCDVIEGYGRVIIEVEQVIVVFLVCFVVLMKGDFVVISVIDIGVGIDFVVVDCIFEFFFIIKSVGVGIGFGFSQVFGFVKQLEGEVDVQSQVGVGICFILYLLLVQVREMMEWLVMLLGLQYGYGVCVLVVEDNVDVVEFVVGVLCEFDYNVVFVYNVDEVLVEFEWDVFCFDVVFSDVVMFGMNGLDLVCIICSCLFGFLVIFISGYSELLVWDFGYGFILLCKFYLLKQLVLVMIEVGCCVQVVMVLFQQVVIVVN